MATSLFNQFSVKGNLKFFKNEDNGEKITIGISVTANHQVDENLYENIEDFLEKLLIADYINEDVYNCKKESEKLQKKQEKDQAKYYKDLEKKKTKTVKTKKAMSSTRSLY
jgi:thiamine pyrophosphate-dependent acetolactate synthase large subunit-like protein